MTKRPPASVVPFLSEDVDGPPPPDQDIHGWCLQGGISKKPTNAKRSFSARFRSGIRNNMFVLFTVLALAIGIGLGFGLRSYNLSQKDAKYLTFPGEILMRMLRLLVLPLIVSSLIQGMSSLNTKASSKMGLRAMAYYMVTTFIAVFWGIIIVSLIQPGKGKKDANASKSTKIEQIDALDAFLDLIRNMFPDNLVEAAFLQYKSKYKNITVTSTNAKGQSVSKIETVPVASYTSGMNALGLVGFSVALGLVIGKMRERGQPLKTFFESLNESLMRLVGIVIWYTPVGVIFLIAGKIVEMDDLAAVGGQLAMYTVTIIVGLIAHSSFILPMLFLILTRRNPYTFIVGLGEALVTAMGTSSSSATLPITLRCLEENNKVDKRVTRFVVPVGATINMDGTALYEAVAAIFIAEVNNLDLNFAHILTISITATAASIGAAGIPQAGLVTMVIVLASIGLPAEDISLIISVDWLLDRLRTATNVLGDSFGAGVVEHWSRNELRLQRDTVMPLTAPKSKPR